MIGVTFVAASVFSVALQGCSSDSPAPPAPAPAPIFPGGNRAVAVGTTHTTQQGTKLAATLSLQFDGPNSKQSSMRSDTVGQQALNISSDILISCASDEQSLTTHSSTGNESSCNMSAAHLDDEHCSDIWFWGDTSNASLVVDHAGECGPCGGPGGCDRWHLPLRNKFGSALLSVNQNLNGIIDQESYVPLDVYFIPNSSEVVAIVVFDVEGLNPQMTMCFESWDTISSIDSATWSLPADWGECQSVTTPPESLQV